MITALACLQQPLESSGR